MAQQLLGKEVNASLHGKITQKVEKLKAAGIEPTLCILRIGENDSDLSYENGAMKRCESLGVTCRRIALPRDVSQEKVLAIIEELNEDDEIHGVLLFRPLPAHLDASLIENALAPEKDVDCMTDLSLAGVFAGKDLGFAPCTAQAVMEILDHYGIDLTGKKAVVVGRSLVVGRPVAMMLMQKNATVTLCHTKTKDLPAVAREADVLVVAAGKRAVVGPECASKGQVVIDVGIHVNEEGKLCGDVAYTAVEPVVASITPVPGGVGTVTTSVLVSHVVDAAWKKLQAGMRA
ncbi:MAG: bifunctional 5,10-methylene-tetrahydrofolate dehydrogenase/5,10-methylene-tetrahydrofolate cyclohydrolase [Blautia sp.]|nr:bifunctional 5,10-methylene-tetrahydrofolate dehydrogenase/5,10-methylene-tetrahydrofolate cyclohydrolase [Blautia sp.]